MVAGDEDRDKSLTRVTLYLAVVASLLWPAAFLALALRGVAETESAEQTAYLNRSALAEAGLATAGLVCAWLARIWARQGWMRHARGAAVLVGPLYLAALIIVLKARLFGP